MHDFSVHVCLIGRLGRIDVVQLIVQVLDFSFGLQAVGSDSLNDYLAIILQCDYGGILYEGLAVHCERFH